MASKKTKTQKTPPPESLGQAPLLPLAPPPPPIFVGVKILGPAVNWVNESMFLAEAAALGQPEKARAVIGRHNPAIAQWVPRFVNDGLFCAIMAGHEEMVDILAPLADASDKRGVSRLLEAAADRGSEASLESLVLRILVPRWKEGAPQAI